MNFDIPGDSLLIAAKLLGLSSICFTWTEESFTITGSQLIIWGILYLTVICALLACEIGTYCLEMEQHEIH